MADKLYKLLAVTDTLAANFKGLLKDYIHFFSKNQGAFLGEKKTYTAQEGTIDDPKKRGTRKVQTTVNEKLSWLEETLAEYIQALFDQEATNASGQPTAELIVGGENWGFFSTLELLRLKSFLENNDLKTMYENIPVRSDAENWSPTSSDEYEGRMVYESPLFSYDNKTTEKESYILPDPNLEKLGAGKQYTPQIGQKTTTISLGTGTVQSFSGEWSQREKAELLRRLKTLHVSVVKALKEANDCEIVESKLKADMIFSYLHGR